MGFPISFLQAASGIPLTKEYWLEDQKLKKNSYPHTSDFTSDTVSINTIEELYENMKQKAKEFKCLLKGRILKDLEKESRAGSTDANIPTRWICLDLDGLKGVLDEEALISRVPCLQGVSYISQASCSMGVEPEKGLSKHLFFLLDSQVDPRLIKDWLIHLNLTIDVLHANIRLTSSHVALRWPLDVSACQNDKLLYIAPPILGEGVVDHFHDERIKFIKKEKGEASINFAEVLLDRNDTEKRLITNKLRKEIGLPPKKKEVFTFVGDIEVLKNPGKAQVTGEKTERGFVYLNLNGGDSWGYYYPEGNSEILFNFKGEPNYFIKELLPRYSAKIAPPQAVTTKKGIQWLAFRDKMTDRYFIGHYDYDKKELDITKTDQKDKLKDFLKSRGQHIPEFVPTWRYEIDFTSDIEFDPDKMFINQYVRSEYMKNANTNYRKVPPLTDMLLSHTFGELKEHFLNWVAVIIQMRIKTDMAWVLTGTQGSGKGVIATKLLAPLIGHNYCHILNNLTSFEKEFNKYMATSLLTFVDESCISDTNQYVKVANKIKSFVTEERISIRQMRTDEYMVPNHNNFMFASNQFNPMQIDIDDRRFMVANRQMKKLFEIMTKTDIEQGLTSELYDFAGYLLNREANRGKASSIIDTEERRQLQELAVDSGTACANAILKGNLQFFINNIPDSHDTIRINSTLNLESPPRYIDIMREFMDSDGKICKIPRKYLQVLFYHTAGIKHDNPGQFTKHMHHKGLFLKQIWHGGENTQGLKDIQWKISEDLKKQWHSICNAEEKGVVYAVK